MADNNLARSRNDLPDFFADDDPLAELARIVGYEDRLAPNSNAAAPAAAPAQRQEPALNLEDELLREFERYDTPRLDPAQDITFDGGPSASNEPAPAISVSGQSTEAEDWDFIPAEPSVADLATDFSDDAAARAPENTGFGDEEPPLASEAAIAPPSSAELVGELVHDEPVSELPLAPDAEAVSVLPEEQPVDEFDLAAELVNSIGGVSSAEAEPELKMEPRGAGAYVPGFRMPLANFNLARAAEPAPRREPTAPEAVEHVVDLPTPVDFPAVREEVSSPDISGSASAPGPAEVLESPAVSVSPAADAVSPVPAGPQRAEDRLSALDELIHDVQRYEIPSSSVTLIATPMIGRPEDDTAPVPQAAVAMKPIMAKAPAVEVPATKTPAVEEKDPFSDEEFELALDDLELDLADIVMEDTRKPPETVAAPVAKIEPAQTKPEAPAAEDAPAAAAPAVDAGSAADLPFDPAQIADSEDQVEAIAELDVPALPAEEPEQSPAYRPDYELDIDAELATLLMTPEKQAPPSPRKPEIDIAASANAAAERPVQPARPAGYSDLDDFERALEEDFRRSLAAPLLPAEHEELRYADADYVATVENARRSAIQKWAVPLALAGVVVLGGVGAYAWLGDGVAAVGSSGEPIVIAADTDPVKVAPENPGGKTVPNQDKAVYERVAGVTSQEPKQETLISSNEEPVDVIQKTLMPDTIPLEGENDIEPTDVGETEDPRLLPQEPEQAAAPAEQQPVAIMPRKVKTMIVRADGKLVEQEAPPPALAAPETEKIPAAGAKPVEIASSPVAAPAGRVQAQPVPATSNVGAAGVIPVSEPVGIANATPVSPVSVEAAPAETVSTPEASIEEAAPAAINAPIPKARPAQQPVNVVAAVTDQGNVRAPNQPSAEPASAPVQVASVAPGGYLIQIASLPSEAEAQKSYQNLSAKFASVIGGRGVDIKAAEIAGKGTFYRVRIPAGSKGDAVALCEKYRAVGGNCLVAR